MRVVTDAVKNEERREGGERGREKESRDHYASAAFINLLSSLSVRFCAVTSSTMTFTKAYTVSKVFRKIRTERGGTGERRYPMFVWTNT